MKKVIKHGEKRIPIYSANCSSCGCIFEYEYSDIESVTYDPRDNTKIERIKCPDCNTSMEVTGLKPIRYETIGVYEREN